MDYMDVSENSGTPKSSILIGFSIINHPFWDTTIFGTTHINSIIPWIADLFETMATKPVRFCGICASICFYASILITGY